VTSIEVERQTTFPLPLEGMRSASANICHDQSRLQIGEASFEFFCTFFSQYSWS